MSDENPDIETEQPDPAETEGMRSIREALSREKARADANQSAAQELAFRKAGLDPAEPTHELFIKAYIAEGGELDPEAIKTNAEKYRINLGGDTPANDPSQTSDRGALGADSFDPAATPDVNPMTAAYEEFSRLRAEESMSAQDASVAVFGKILEEARAGNKRFIFDEVEWQSSDAARSR